METVNPSTGKGLRSEYAWVPLMYVAFAASVLALLFTVPLDDQTLVAVVVLMIVVVNGAMLGLCVRALRRIEAHLGTER